MAGAERNYEAILEAQVDINAHESPQAFAYVTFVILSVGHVAVDSLEGLDY